MTEFGPHSPTGECNIATAYIVSPYKSVAMILHNRYNVWMPPGGHAEPGESNIRSLSRELLQETGFKRHDYSWVDTSHPLRPTCTQMENSREPIPFDNNKYIVDEKFLHSDSAYIFTSGNEIPPNPLPNESQDVEWLTVSNIESLGSDEVYPVIRSVGLIAIEVASLVQAKISV